MAEQRPMTQQEWLAHLADVRGRATIPGATLTADEWRDFYLAQLGERVANLERKVGDVDHGLP